MHIEIESLRHLDKLVAESIFNWCDFWESPISQDIELSSRYLMGYPPQEQAMGIDAERQEVWNYSTDIASAWSITEKFYSATIDKLSNGAEYNAYLVTTDGKANVDGYARAKTMQIALCLAALKTKGIQVSFQDASWRSLMPPANPTDCQPSE